MNRSILFLIIAVLVLLLSSWLLPVVLIPTGVRAFEGDRRTFAVHALQQAKLTFSGSAEASRVIKLRVQSVIPAQGGDVAWRAGCGSLPDYRAEVAAYTFFGVRYATIEVFCRGGRRLR